MKFRFKRKLSFDIPQTEQTIEKLISDFEPEKIAPIKIETIKNEYKIAYKNKKDFCTFDVFDLKNKNKKNLKKVIQKYGIGTCGPPGFYGTLDLHKKLEKLISQFFKKTECVLYSNYFTCINSLLSCFIAKVDTIFFHSETTEPVLRGIYSSKAQNIKYKNLKSLEKKLKKLKKLTKERYFVYFSEIILGKRQNLKKLKELKEKYKFHLFLEISDFFSYKKEYEIADFLIGNFKILSSSGAFVCGSEYQRLMSSSICFSASLPAFLCANSLLNLQRLLFFPEEKVILFSKIIKKYLKEKKSLYILISTNLPYFYLQKKDIRENKYEDEYLRLMKIKEKFFHIQILKNPLPRIMLILKITDIKYKKEIMNLINYL